MNEKNVKLSFTADEIEGALKKITDINKSSIEINILLDYVDQKMKSENSEKLKNEDLKEDNSKQTNLKARNFATNNIIYYLTSNEPIKDINYLISKSESINIIDKYLKISINTIWNKKEYLNMLLLSTDYKVDFIKINGDITKFYFNETEDYILINSYESIYYKNMVIEVFFNERS